MSCVMVVVSCAHSTRIHSLGHLANSKRSHPFQLAEVVTVSKLGKVTLLTMTTDQCFINSILFARAGPSHKDSSLELSLLDGEFQYKIPRLQTPSIMVVLVRYDIGVWV